MLAFTLTTLTDSLTSRLAQAAGGETTLIAPALLFVLAAFAAAGVILLLPARREAVFRTLGGALLLAVAVIFAAVIARAAGGMGAYFWIFSAIALLGAVRVITHPKPVYSALYFVLTVMATAGLFVLMWAEFMAAALVLIYAGAILVTYVFVIMLAAEAQPETPAGSQAATMRQRMIEYDAVSREPVAATAVGFALLGMLLFVIFDRAEEDPRDTAGGVGAMTAQAQVAPTTPATPATPAAPVAAPAPTPPGDVTVPAAATQPAVFQPVGQTQRLGTFLFRHQLANLELAGLILTVAMVGAIVIARRRVVGPAAVAGAGGGASGDLIAPATPIDDNPHSIPVYGTENPRQKEYPET